MNNTKFLKVERTRSIVQITIIRPDLHNAFNEVVIEEVTAAFKSLGERDDVRVIVLAGEGKSFCAGADLHWMKRMVDYSFEENVADAMLMCNMLRAIHDCPKPTIARVHGAAFGGGVGLTAACDMAVATESATFCLSEVKLGIIPAVISPFVLEKVGSAARRYCLTAERFKGLEAKRIGLVSDTVPDEAALDPWIDDVAKSILANGPEAVAAAKVMIREVRAFDWDRAARITTEQIAKRRISSEGQEGMKAFLEKRPPNWIAD
jgi:methylglutaconyl-CoA hydratase